MTEPEKPDCLFPEEVKRMIRSFEYIKKKNYELNNRTHSGKIAFQGIRDRCIVEITLLRFILKKRRVDTPPSKIDYSFESVKKAIQGHSE